MFYKVRLLHLVCSSLAASVLLGAWLPAQDATPEDHEESATFFQAVLGDYVAGAGGDAARLDALVAACDAEIQEHPDRGLPVAFRGFALVYRCGQSFESGDFQTGMKLWSEGLSALDRAGRLAPEDPYVRFVRGRTLVDVWQHDPMQGEQLARRSAGDLDHARRALPELWSGLDAEERGWLLLKTASAWEHAGEGQKALACVEAVLATAPGTKAAVEAADWEATARDVREAAEESTELGSVERFDLLVRADLLSGLEGDWARVEKAMAVCEEALAQNPENAGALCWHGFGLRMRARKAREEGRHEEAARLDTAGMVELNRAVAWEPDNVGPLLVRGSTLIYSTKDPSLPADEAGSLLSLGVYDYERVYRLQREQGYFDYLSEHARGELLTGLADGWHRLGNASQVEKYFGIVSESLPDTSYAATARSYLAGEAKPEELAARSCAGCH